MHIIFTFCQENCRFVKLITDSEDLSGSDIKMASLNHWTLRENNRSAGRSQKKGKERVVFSPIQRLVRRQLGVTNCRHLTP